MPLESLTYDELAARLHISGGAARAMVRRRRWPRSLGNDGKARIQADLSEIACSPSVAPAQAPPSPLLARIEELQAELAACAATSAQRRGDYERERDRYGDPTGG